MSYQDFYFDDDDDDFYDDDGWCGDCGKCEDCLDKAMDECGMSPDGDGCDLAGTEFCDWDCPLRPVWEMEEAGEPPESL